MASQRKTPTYEPRRVDFTRQQERAILAAVRKQRAQGYDGAVVTWDERPDGTLAAVYIFGQTLSKSERA